MKKIKIVLALILVIFTFSTTIPVSAVNDVLYGDENNLIYEIVDDKAVINGFKYAEQDVSNIKFIFPERLEGYPVVAINNFAQGFKEIVFPDKPIEPIEINTLIKAEKITLPSTNYSFSNSLKAGFYATDKFICPVPAEIYGKVSNQLWDIMNKSVYINPTGETNELGSIGSITDDIFFYNSETQANKNIVFGEYVDAVAIGMYSGNSGGGSNGNINYTHNFYYSYGKPVDFNNIVYEMDNVIYLGYNNGLSNYTYNNLLPAKNIYISDEYLIDLYASRLMSTGMSKEEAIEYLDANMSYNNLSEIHQIALHKYSFNANGGCFSDGTEQKDIYCIHNENFELPDTPHKNDYKFIGWSVKQSNGELKNLEKATALSQTLYAQYDLADVELNVKYIDIDTNEELCTPETISGKALTEYTTEAKEFENYVLVATPENASGILHENSEDVVYYYSLKPTSVVVNYLDLDGNCIAESKTIEGKINQEYTTEAENIEGYSLYKTPDNATGIMTEDVIFVDYLYILNEIEAPVAPDEKPDIPNEPIVSTASTPQEAPVVTGVVETGDSFNSGIVFVAFVLLGILVCVLKLILDNKLASEIIEQRSKNNNNNIK